MDALALLCTLHADGPTTLKRLRRSGCEDLSSLVDDSVKLGEEFGRRLLKLADERWSWRRVLSRRLFHDRTTLPAPWPTLYRRGWDTPLLPSNGRHDLKHAY